MKAGEVYDSPDGPVGIIKVDRKPKGDIPGRVSVWVIHGDRTIEGYPTYLLKRKLSEAKFKKGVLPK